MVKICTLKFIDYSIIADKQVLIAPLVFEGIVIGDRVQNIKRITLNGITLNDSDFTLFDGSQTIASQILIDTFGYWTKYHLLFGIPYIVFHIPFRKEFVNEIEGMSAEAEIEYIQNGDKQSTDTNRVHAFEGTEGNRF